MKRATLATVLPILTLLTLLTISNSAFAGTCWREVGNELRRLSGTYSLVECQAQSALPRHRNLVVVYIPGEISTDLVLGMAAGGSCGIDGLSFGGSASGNQKNPLMIPIINGAVR